MKIMIQKNTTIRQRMIFMTTIRSMAEGELLQLERSYDPSVTEAHYFRVIERKSAVLLSAATIFEGFDTNTLDSAREVAQRYELDIPVGHDPGPNRSGSILMRRYRTGES